MLNHKLRRFRIASVMPTSQVPTVHIGLPPQYDHGRMTMIERIILL